MAVEGRMEAGQQIAGYRIEELVGRGGMGEVYRARDERLERYVALKILAPRYAEDEDFRERLLRESRLAASLDHPNVVPVYDAGEADERFYLAMRLVEGTDLRALLRREGALEPERTVEIVAQVADALDAAHGKGLVHRDVKPSNVLLDERGHCYLADFGLTESVSGRDRPVDGQALGTLDYVAPEQIRGDPIDGRADVYSLACVIFECLTGVRPFERPSEVATLYAHLEDEPPRPSGQRRDLPGAVDAVLAQAMAKDPGSRPARAGELVDELRGTLGLAQPGRAPRGLAVVAASLAAALVAGLAAAVLLLRDGGVAPPATGSLIRIDPASGAVVSRHALSSHPGVVTTAAGRVWVGDFREGVLWRLNPSTGQLTRLSSAGEPRDLTSLGAKVWVASDSTQPLTGTVTRYDAQSGQREGGVPILACSLGAGQGVVWVTGCPAVQRLSTDVGVDVKVLRTVMLPYPSPRTGENDRVSLHDVAVGEGSVWVTGDMSDRRVWRLDRHTGRILATIELPFAPRTIAAGEGGIWVTAPIDDVVARIDPVSNRVVERIAVGRGAAGVAVGVGSVWVANALDGTVSRIDPRRREVVETIEVGGLLQDVAVGAGGVWVTADAD